MDVKLDVPEPRVSVRDLVRRRTGDDHDTWDLVLVHRAEVWDQVRMRRLLDSLLAAYPTGSPLLCRVAAESRVVRVQGSERVVLEADARDWQRHASFLTLVGHFRIRMQSPTMHVDGMTG